jgi:hypothetical protein
VDLSAQLGIISDLQQGIVDVATVGNDVMVGVITRAFLVGSRCSGSGAVKTAWLARSHA